MIRILLSVLVGTGITAGQFCLATLARNLTPPWTPTSLLSQVLVSPWLYAAIAIYILAIGAYLGMLRHYPISTTNLPIIAVIVALNLLLAVSPNEALGAAQIVGVLCVGVGILLMMGG